MSVQTIFRLFAALLVAFGMLAGAVTLVAAGAGYEILVQEDDGDDPDDPSEGYYCRQSEDQHPFGARLAERYGTGYETLQGWFCGGFGWGQIMLALKTGEITGDQDTAALLERRAGGLGWGQIWQELGLIGRPEDAGPPNDENGDGRPDHGPPPWAGPKDRDGDGFPDSPGPPPWAGPKDDDGDGPPWGKP